MEFDTKREEAARKDGERVMGALRERSGDERRRRLARYGASERGGSRGGAVGAPAGRSCKGPSAEGEAGDGPTSGAAEVAQGDCGDMSLGVGDGWYGAGPAGIRRLIEARAAGEGDGRSNRITRAAVGRTQGFSDGGRPESQSKRAGRGCEHWLE